MTRYLFFIALLSVFYSHAQISAITDEGEEVVLYDDGTWKFVNNNNQPLMITLNEKEFSKPKSASFKLKSSIVDMNFWLNPKLWSFGKAKNNPAAEYELQLKGKDLYAMIICEKVEIPLVSLKKIAYENARLNAPDLEIVEQDYRMVNGKKMLFLQMDGTIQGIKFSYFGYYFSSESGTVQFLAYTSQNLLSEYRQVCEDLVNGMECTE